MDKVNIFYRVVSDQLQILRVHHSARTVPNFGCSDPAIQIPRVIRTWKQKSKRQMNHAHLSTD